MTRSAYQHPITGEWIDPDLCIRVATFVSVYDDQGKELGCVRDDSSSDYTDDVFPATFGVYQLPDLLYGYGVADAVYYDRRSDLDNVPDDDRRAVAPLLSGAWYAVLYDRDRDEAVYLSRDDVYCGVEDLWSPSGAWYVDAHNEEIYYRLEPEY